MYPTAIIQLFISFVTGLNHVIPTLYLAHHVLNRNQCWTLG